MSFACQFVAGLAVATPLFLLAAGLSLIFTATGTLSFAQGAVATLGASLAWAVVGQSSGSPADVLVAFGSVAVITAMLGAVAEIALFRRFAALPFLLRCLGTIALSLVLSGVRVMLWDPEALAMPSAGWLGAAPSIGGLRLPVVVLVRIGTGLVASVVLLFACRQLLSPDAGRWRRTIASAVGTGLAGLAGALVLLDTPVDPGLDLRLLTGAFVVAAIGGLGNITGALLAALLIGQLQIWGGSWLPQTGSLLPFAAMALVLAARPGGLFGTSQIDGPASPPATLPIRATPLVIRLLGALALLLAAALPFMAPPGLLFSVASAAIAMLFAASLQVVVGPGGMPSFGHAALFGTGAYAAALLAPIGTAPALVGATLAAGLLAFLIGSLVARLAAPVLAMLTLVLTEAAATMARYVPDWLGDRAGLRDVRPSVWLDEPALLYWLIVTLSCGGTMLLRRSLRARFGFELRAARDDPARARSIGLFPPLLRVAAFTLGGTLAGLAGGLAAFARGGVSPTDLAAGSSVDGLLMLLLGGLEALSGPVVGALAYTGLAASLPTVAGASQLLLGLAVLGLVLLLPAGIAGTSIRRWRRGT